MACYQDLVVVAEIKEECIYCIQPLDDFPASGKHCGHVFHVNCMIQAASVGGAAGLRCPLCRCGKGFEELISKYYLSSMRWIELNEAHIRTLVSVLSCDVSVAI